MLFKSLVALNEKRGNYPGVIIAAVMAPVGEVAVGWSNEALGLIYAAASAGATATHTSIRETEGGRGSRSEL